MTCKEIIQAISDDKMMPFIQPAKLAEIVDFVIKNYKPSLPSDLDEAANNWITALWDTPGTNWTNGDILRSFRAGAEWMAGQGITVGGMFHHSCGYPSVIELNTYLRGYEGKEVIVQIRKK